MHHAARKPAHVDVAHALVAHERAHDALAARPGGREDDAVDGLFEAREQVRLIDLLDGQARELRVAQRGLREAALCVEHARPARLVLHERLPRDAVLMHPLVRALHEALRVHVVVRLQVRRRGLHEKKRALLVRERGARRVDARTAERRARALKVARAHVHAVEQKAEAHVRLLERGRARRRAHALDGVGRHRLDKRVLAHGHVAQPRDEPQERSARELEVDRVRARQRRDDLRDARGGARRDGRVDRRLHRGAWR